MKDIQKKISGTKKESVKKKREWRPGGRKIELN